MKHYIRQIIPFFIGILIIIGIFIVDVVFYRVPSFVKVFRIEREAAAVVSLLLTFPLIKKIYFEKIDLIRQKFLTFLISSFTLILFVLLPHLMIKKYIVLWDNNPMLAEYPTLWNAYSVLCAVLFSLMLMLFIQIIKNLVFKQNEHLFYKIVYRIIFVAIVLIAVMFNTIEDRYLYQPVLDGYMGLFNNYKLGIYLFLGMSVVFAFGSSWLDDLNKRDKIICFISSLITALILLYLFWSKYIVAIYAFSTTVKGFVLVGFLFVLSFLAITTVKILFYLPTAGKVDRVSRELQFLSEIETIIKQKVDEQKIIERVIDFSYQITEANGCWLELRENSDAFRINHYLNIESELVDGIGSFTVDDIKTYLIDRRKFLLIENIRDNDLTKDFRYLEIPWKSLLAIPVAIDDKVVAILYLVKNKIKGFSKKDEKTLRRFMVHLEPIISKRLSGHTGRDQIEQFQIRQNNYMISVIGSPKMQYLTICEGNYFDCCILGVSKQIKSNDLLELKGSLKILMKMNENISDIAHSIENLLDISQGHVDYIFVFLNTEKDQLAVIKSGSLFYGNSYDDINVINKSCKITEHPLGQWEILKKDQEKLLDLSQFQKFISGHEKLSETELSNNFHSFFGKDLQREDFILIQRVSM